jgi:hypothetical protein
VHPRRVRPILSGTGHCQFAIWSLYQIGRHSAKGAPLEYMDTRSERLKNLGPPHYRRVAGQRAWDPPEPIPNSEVKPRSVSGISVVFGHVKPEKLAAHFAQQSAELHVHP